MINREKIHMERRIRIYRASKQLLARIFNGLVKVTGASLPADAVVTCVNYDYACDGLFVAVWSESFDVVPEGAPVPGLLDEETAPTVLELVSSAVGFPDPAEEESWRKRPSQL